jgi:tetracycline 7-halogenase / FADH2 O2-dependent halogenase
MNNTSNSNGSPPFFDMVIIGSGLAGGCLARQMTLEHPNLKVLVLEKKENFDYWIGESTVEVFYDYITRTLKMGPYMWKKHFMKHGLRFFWDNEQHTLSTPEMSENGRCPYAVIPAFQLDRAEIDSYLVKVNREAGVDVRMGVKVDKVDIDGENGHVVHSTAGDFKCKYVVDAGGFAAPLARQMKLTQIDERHQVGSAWARYKHTIPIDELGDAEWQRRVGYTQRHLSTNHYMYRGYWVWNIALDEDIISLGVTYDKRFVQPQVRNAEELTAFFRQHRSLDDLLGKKAEAVDFMSYQHLARFTNPLFSTDRWFITGMAGSFFDPMQSQQSVTFTTYNRYISRMIKSDLEGNAKRFKSEVEHFNIFARQAYEDFATSLNYHIFGSHDAFIGWRHARQAQYWNIAVTNSITDLKFNFDVADAHKEGCHCTIEKACIMTTENSMAAAVNRLAREFVKFVDEKGTYYERNKGEYQESTERWSIQKKLWLKERDLAWEHQEDLHSYEATYRFYVARMAQMQGIPLYDALDEFFIPDWNSGQTLAQGVEVLREAQKRGDPPAKETRWNPQGPPEEFRWDYHMRHVPMQRKEGHYSLAEMMLQKPDMSKPDLVFAKYEMMAKKRGEMAKMKVADMKHDHDDKKHDDKKHDDMKHAKKAEPEMAK